MAEDEKHNQSDDVSVIRPYGHAGHPKILMSAGPGDEVRKQVSYVRSDRFMLATPIALFDRNVREIYETAQFISLVYVS